MESLRDANGLPEPSRLSVCPLWGLDFVVPVDGSEEHEYWRVRLRCGACGVLRDTIASETEVETLCDDIDAGLARLAAGAERLNRERRETEIEIFAAALRRDLITGEDFVR